MSSIAIYARVSTDHQVTNNTIEAQISSLKEKAKSRGYVIDPNLIFTDNGVSGAVLERPALDALRDRAFYGDIDKVLVLCPDRLARKSAHQLILIEEFEKLGVSIEFVDRKVSSNPDDQLLLQIQGVISEYEREKIMERSRRGKIFKAKSNKISVLGCAPYGYIYIRKGDSEDARYEINFREAKVVKRIFKTLTEQKISLQKIANLLTSENIPTPGGGDTWSRSTVYGIITNPTYCGEAAFGKTKVCKREKKIKSTSAKTPSYSSQRITPVEKWIKIKVPAIIDKKTYDQGLEILKENRRFSNRNSRRQYLLTSLLRCNECGYAYYGRPNHYYRTQHEYYRCLGADAYRWGGEKRCTQKPIDTAMVDDLVWEQIKAMIRNPQLVLHEYSDRITNEKNYFKNIDAAITQKTRKAKQKKNEKERVIDLYQQGMVTENEIKDRLTNLNAQINQFEKEADVLTREKDDKKGRLALIEQFEEFAKKMGKNIDNACFQTKKKIIQMMVEEVRLNARDQEMKINHIIPISKKSQLCPGSQR